MATSLVKDRAMVQIHAQSALCGDSESWDYCFTLNADVPAVCSPSAYRSDASPVCMCAAESSQDLLSLSAFKPEAHCIYNCLDSLEQTIQPAPQSCPHFH